MSAVLRGLKIHLHRYHLDKEVPLSWMVTDEAKIQYWECRCGARRSRYVDPPLHGRWLKEI